MSIGYSCRLSANQHNDLACPITSTIGGEQGERMSPSPDTLVGRKRPRTRSKTQRVEGGIVEGSEDINHLQQEAEIPDLGDINWDKEQSDRRSFYDILEEDTMPYPYSKYKDGTDAEVHVHDFLTTWEVNHVS